MCANAQTAPNGSITITSLFNQGRVGGVGLLSRHADARSDDSIGNFFTHSSI